MNPTVRYIYASMLGKKSYMDPYKTEHNERVKYAKYVIDVLKGKAIHDYQIRK